MDYPRYQPRRRRPPGAGAFYDWTVFVARERTPKLRSCRIDRRWHRQVSGEFAPAAGAKPCPAP